MHSRADRQLFIGLMSGTSTDGVDAVLADFSGAGQPLIMSSASLPMPQALRTELLDLNSPGHNELARAANASVQLANLYARACHQVLDTAGVAPTQVCAIGAHGQTVRHDPAAGFSIQLNAPARLAELTGIDVIADFRSRDIAAGGQGAPLVPAFHQAMFQCGYPRIVLNLGGIANITVLDPAQPLCGFDTGPANALLDLWCHEKTGRLYDEDGRWAGSGHSHPALLAALFDSEPWFRLPPPKSTGRDLFNRDWLMKRLAPFEQAGLADNDVQATLQSLTALSIEKAVSAQGTDAREMLVCGGGALNSNLMQELEQRLQITVRPTSALGVPVQSVEALAFAWLARAYTLGQPAGIPSVTGAHAPTVLGARYPA